MTIGFNNINGPRNKPAILEAQNMQNNGGGGNLGYFEQQRKKKEENSTEEDKDIFVKEDEKDNSVSFWDKIKNLFKKNN